MGDVMGYFQTLSKDKLMAWIAVVIGFLLIIIALLIW